MKITIDELKDKIHGLTTEDDFDIKFTKADGTEREYCGCKVGVHIIKENATRHGVSAKTHEQVHGNLLFYIPAEEKYRCAKYASIKQVTIKGEVYEIAG